MAPWPAFFVASACLCWAPGPWQVCLQGWRNPEEGAAEDTRRGSGIFMETRLST